MAFIGNTNTTQAFTPAVDFFSGNASTTAFTLSRPVASVAQVQAVISNVPQDPGSAYTVSGSTITFTSAPPSGTNNIYVYYTSPITQVIAPGQGTVDTASLSASLAVPAAQLTGTQTLPRGTLPTGSVLQVVQATYTTATSTTSTSFVTTGLSTSITPSSSTSKILVLMNMGDVASQNSGAGVNAAGFTLYKNGSNLTSNLGAQISYNSISTSGLTIVGFSSAYLDSPATTSSTTYAVFFKTAGAVSTVTVFRDGTLGVITLMEIAA